MPGRVRGSPAVIVDGRRFDWAPGATVSVGREAGSDVVVEGTRVSRSHFLVEAVEGGWLLRDVGSRNGTYVDGASVDELRLDGPIEVRLGSPTEGPVLLVEIEEMPAEEASPSPGEATPPADGATDQALDGSPAAPAPPSSEAGPPAHPAPPQEGATRPGGVAVSAAEEPKSELGRFSMVHVPSATHYRIGRSADNDLALPDDPRASRHHAELRRLSSVEAELADLDSHNGTFLNGHRINHAVVHEGDTIGIGNHVFRFHNGALEEFTQTDEASLDVSAVSVLVEGSTLLDAVSFSIPSRSLLAVVGPSGAGKTTLLRALTGFSEPTQGAIRFGGRDLYADYDELRARLGYVPQEDLVHEQLTVRQELEFAAALRLPPDLGQAGFTKRADEVMAELGLTARAELSIEKLSGGQRKRVSVGIELLTQPALLYLDEPTSGLDPGNERQVMQVLRDLADGGRIVVVVTHSTQSIDIADRVLFLATGGHMAYFGPPQEALAYFERHGVEGGWPAVFQALEGSGGEAWGDRFRNDPDFERYVGRISAAPAPAPAPAPSGAARVPSGRARLLGPVHPRRQTLILCRRQLRLITGDRRTLILLAAQAPIFGIILTLLFPAHTIATNRGPFAAMLLWLLIVSATWLGSSNTVREIVKEKSIYRRERASGLSMAAYTGSKVIVFGAITMVQSLVVLLIVLITQPLPPADPTHIIPTLKLFDARYGQHVLTGLRPFNVGSLFPSQALEVYIAMCLAGLAGMAIGLLVSASVRKSDQAVFMLPVILIIEMALSQPILQLSNPSPILKILGDLTSANWGVNAVASTTSLNQLMTDYEVSLTYGTDYIKSQLGIGTPPKLAAAQAHAALYGDPRWAHTTGNWFLAIFILVLMIVLFLAGTLVMMRRLDTGTRRTLLEDVQGLVGTAAARARAAAPAGGAGASPARGWTGAGAPPPAAGNGPPPYEAAPGAPGGGAPPGTPAGAARPQPGPPARGPGPPA